MNIPIHDLRKLMNLCEAATRLHDFIEPVETRVSRAHGELSVAIIELGDKHSLSEPQVWTLYRSLQRPGALTLRDLAAIAKRPGGAA